MLVYRAVSGELIGGLPAAERADPASACQRLARLPAAAQLPLFDTLIDLHQALADLGWVACDLYDGSLIVDFATLTLRVIDLDEYRRGPSRNNMGRMFGSTRFVAPEEFEPGAALDQRTTVFTLGRIVRHFTTRLTEDPRSFRRRGLIGQLTWRVLCLSRPRVPGRRTMPQVSAGGLSVPAGMLPGCRAGVMRGSGGEPFGRAWL